MSAPHIVIMAGGTGGHIFPGLAVANELQNAGWQVTWLGTSDRMEAHIVPKHGFDIEFIDIQGLRGHGMLRKLLAPMKIFKAIMQCRRIFKQLKPDVVLGMGGYASGPGGIAARMLSIPLVLHEQNAVAGMTNKWLSRIATSIMCAFPNTFPDGKNAKSVGNPVRTDLFAIRRTGSVSKDSKNVLVIGGSLGAKALNESIPDSLQHLSTKVNVWHQCGRDNRESVEQRYSDAQAAGGLFGKVTVSEFVDDMATAYQWADIVICRAGALTVSEVAATSSVAIFVPLPHAVDDHQTRNASYLVENEAAVILPQSELEAGALTKTMSALFSTSATLACMSRRAKQLARPDAAKEVAEACSSLAQKAVNL